MAINICMDFQDVLADNGGIFEGEQNGERGGAMLTPSNELVLTLWGFTSVPILVKIAQEMRP